MKKNGFQFLIDDSGEKTAVIIDLKKHRQLWEDFYDLLMIESRRAEPRVEWKDVKKRLLAKKRHA